MKQLKCEMCNSTDFIKQDGVFVCQECGCKYSVEEAKKLMGESAAEVTDTVKTDSSNELENLYQLARRAKDTENNENAAKYYDMILIKDPTSWEAYFYSVYFKSMGCKIADIPTAATSVNNCIESTMELIKTYVADETAKQNAILEVCEKSKNISKLLFDGANSWMEGIDQSVRMNFAGQFLSASIASAGIVKTLCDKLCSVFSDDEYIMRNITVPLLKERIAEGIVVKPGDLYLEVIGKYDPNYIPPKPEVAPSSNNTDNSGGCYVATCVYGSYDCPQVWTLRRFRDNTLAETMLGRTFIRTYYAISPTLVKWFGDTAWFKRMWKGTLDRMVSKLQDNGIESTPYEDKNL